MRSGRSSIGLLAFLLGLGLLTGANSASAQFLYKFIDRDVTYHTNLGCAADSYTIPDDAFSAIQTNCSTFCVTYDSYAQANPTVWAVTGTVYQTCNPPISRSDPSTAVYALFNGTGTCDTASGWLYGNATTEFPFGSCFIQVVKKDRTKKHCKDCFGNPLQPGIGNKRQEEADYVGAGGLPLTFKRIFNSAKQFDTSWTHNFAYRVTYSMGAGQTVAIAHRPEGDYSFTLSGSVWIPDSDVNLKLTGSSSGFVITTADGLRRETYDPYNNIGSISDASSVVRYSFSYIGESPRLLSTVSNAFGQSISLGYDAQNRLSTLTTPTGVVNYGYDTDGNLTTATYPDASVRTYVYNELAFTGGASLPKHLTGIVDESTTRFANFGYDTSGLAVLTEHAGGVDRVSVSYGTAPAVVCTQTFDVPNQTMFEDCGNTAPSGVTITDSLGTTRSFGFTEINGSVRITGTPTVCTKNCPPTPKSRTFDANGNITSSRDFNDVLSCSAFDTTRNLETVRVEGLASTVANCPANLASYTPTPGTRERKIVTSWHSTLRVPMAITEANRTTTFTYNAVGDALTRTVTDTSVVPSVARTWTYTYNGYGRVLTEDGPRTDVTDLTTYTYYTCTTGYQCGQLNTVTNAAGHVTTINAYNASGQPTQITDPNGLVTTIAYSNRQRVTDRCVGGALPTCVGGELTHVDYWPTGLLKKVTNPGGSFIEYAHDAAHRLTQINDGDNNKIVYTLDNAGNRTIENTYDPTLVLKRTHSRVFNSLNQLWKDVNAAGTVNVTTAFGYDNNGNQTSVNAPLSRNSTNIYDELNRLKQITDPASGITQFDYDANDNLASVTDPRNLVTSYAYNGFGDLKTQTSPDTALTTNTYDSGGNLETRTDARSAITTYNYDVLNRVTSAAFKIGATTDQTIAYVYDAGTNGKGHLTSASDADHALAWSYDLQGRVTGKGQTVGAVTKSVGYGYSATGQLTQLVLPSGNTIQYGYNTNGQVTSVTLQGTPNVTIVSNVNYDPFGPITGWTWGNAKTTTRTFDTDGKLTGITNTTAVVPNRTFGYDDAFRITSATESGGSSWALGYDLMDRLTSATGPSTIGYTYDANGNRLTQTGSSASTYTVSGTSNKLSSTSGALARTYNYTASGSVLTSGATTHTYYNSGRMKTGTLGAASATTYVYNALGQRVKKTGGAAITTIYMYDEAGHVLGEYDSTGALVQETVWLGDTPIATLRPNGSNVTLFYVHTDQLNTPRKVTSNAATPVLRWNWDPTPFGDGTPTEPAGTFNYNLRFPGQLFDSESDLNYNYFRDYDPAVGRYVESDPFGLFGGPSTYAYVNGRPVRFSDRLGLAEDTIDAGIQSAVARGDIARLESYLDAAGLSPAQETAAQAGLRNILNRLTGNTKKLAELLGKKAKEVEKAIESCKQVGMPKSGPIRNPNVKVDPISGEVFPELAEGGIGDSIGNIFDFL